MYYFSLVVIDMDNDKEIVRPITIDSQWFDNEKDVYMEAMRKALNCVAKNEMFYKLIFIAC